MGGELVGDGGFCWALVRRLELEIPRKQERMRVTSASKKK